MHSAQAAVTQKPLLGARPALTGLRAFAVVLVMLHHEGLYLSPADTRWFAHDGYLGVDVFFVLSGFLITSLLLDENQKRGRVGIGGFYVRRARRLLPALGALLAIWTAWSMTVEHVSLGSMAASAGIVAGYGTNFYTAFGQTVVTGFGHLWSLAVEEQFYLVWPVVLIVAPRRCRPGVLASALGVAIVASAIDMAVTFRTAGNLAAYDRTDCRAGALLIGCLAAVAWREGWVRGLDARWFALPTLAVMVALFEIWPPSPDVMFNGGFTVVELLSAVVVIGLLTPTSSARALFAARSTVVLGELSYAMYLWHIPVLAIIVRHFHTNLAVQSLVYWPSVVAIAALSQVLVERPFRRARREAAPIEATAIPAQRRARAPQRASA